MANLIDQVSAAKNLYAESLREAQFTIDGLFKQSGFNLGGGKYNPEEVMNMTPEQQAALIAGTQETSMGAAGDTRAAGVTEEANMISNSISRGLTGGLANYGGSSSEATTETGVGKIKSAFLTDVLNQTGKVGSAFDLQNESINNAFRTQTEATAAAYAANPTTSPQGNPFVTKGTPGGNFPKAPKGGTPWTGPGGVSWQYRINGPSGKGWYKK